MFNKNKLKYNRKYLQKGMTLIELLVVLAIFMLVAGLTIFDYGKFRSNVSLQNLADDIALSVRRAQGKAIGVGSSLSTFANGYGIHFSTSKTSTNPLSGSNKSFIIFNDIPGASGYANKLYDYDQANRSSLCDSTTLRSGNECIDLLNITSSDEIEFICPNSDPANCISGSADIVFLRPNPDAYICASTGTDVAIVSKNEGLEQMSNIVNFDVSPDIISGSKPDANGFQANGCPNPLKSVDIIVKNLQSGDTKTITISSIGQISVN